MTGNEGIQMYGGSINVGGSLATGRNASAVSHVGLAVSQLAERGHGEVAARLAEVAAAIERDRSRLADAEAAVERLEAAAVELERPSPDRSRLGAILAGLKEAIGFRRRRGRRCGGAGAGRGRAVLGPLLLDWPRGGPVPCAVCASA